MARRLSIPKLTKRIPQLDAEFSALLSASASPEHLAAFVVRNYLPVAYIFALRMHRSHTESEAMGDQVSERAISAIEDIVRRIQAGSFTFRGDSRFSTYLFSTLRQTNRRRTYVPKAVAMHGTGAEKAFHLLYVEGRDHDETRQLLQSELSLHGGEADELIRVVREAVRGSSVVARLDVRRDPVAFDHTEPAEQTKTIAATDEPASIFLKDVVKERTERALDLLEPDDREIITLHYIGGASIREIGRRLRLASPQYRFERARDRFLELAESLDLRGVYDAAMGEGRTHG